LNGLLTVTIDWLWGDFYFASSSLSASGVPNEEMVPTPEPASMLLFGTGLLVIAGRYRNRRRSSN
jgi:hypothetical protein